MKTQIFWTLMIFLMVGCYTTKKVEKVTLPPAQGAIKKEFVPWFQDNDINIAVGDPVNFYNQYRINVIGKIPIEIKMLRNGKFIVKDSSINVNYSIPAKTCGKLVYVEPGMGGKPVSFTIQFEEGEDVENQDVGSNENKVENYNQVFNILSDKSFTLVPRVKITVRGEEYYINATLNGDGSGKCRILVDKDTESNITNVGKPATGVQKIEGTKTIKK